MDCSWETSAFLSTVTTLPRKLIAVLIDGTNSEYLTALSSAALSLHLTYDVFTYFEPLALELCARWTAEHQDVAVQVYGKILPMMPHLSDLAQSSFKSQGREVDLLHRLQPGGVASRELLLAVFRLLMFDNTSFAKYVRPAKLQLLFQHKDRSIRYLAIRVMCLYIHASDAVFQDMITKHLGSDPVFGLWEGQTIDYGFLSLWEEKRLRDLNNGLKSTREKRQNAQDENKLVRILQKENFSDKVTVIQGVLLLRSDNKSAAMNNFETLVLTPSAVLNSKNFANALLGRAPLLLTGLAGCGKTLLVKQFAAQLNKLSTMVTLHINEQSDSKLLLGIYMTGAQPGSFKWQAGVLTTAVKEGRWVFIEDLDRAPNEVISTILPLIERRELFIPNRGERIVAASGFRIIATMRSSLNLHGSETVPHTKMLGNRFWHRITVLPPSSGELEYIITVRYPLLFKYIPRIMAVYRRLRLETTEKPIANRYAASMTRSVSARELMKWCGRISELLTTVGSRTGTEPVSGNVLDEMFLDAGDCFAGGVVEDVIFNYLMSGIAEELHVDPQRKDHLLYDRHIQHKMARRTTGDVLIIGRTVLHKSASETTPGAEARIKNSSYFALSRHSLRLMEQIAVAVQRKEPLLLVGETGIGKTAAIQHLSNMLGHGLLAINLSQQSEGGDLLGGYKPVNIRRLVMPMKDEFDALFEETFSFKKNEHFVEILGQSIAKGQWKRVLKLWKEALKTVDKKFWSLKDLEHEQSTSMAEQRVKRRKVAAMSLLQDRYKWDAFAAKVHSLQSNISNASAATAFSFVEGKLVKAVRDGGWVLLDEINLATPDTLECLSDLLDAGPDSNPSILLTESGDVERIRAHPNFRVFAAMNPATDVGKKDLPLGIRSRFTEIYVNSPDRDVQSLQSIVSAHLDRAAHGISDRKLVSSVTELYMEIQRLVKETGLVDGTGQRPLYSLRTLTRALTHATTTAHQCNIRRALYEAFSMCFFTCLEMVSEARLRQLVVTKLYKDAVTAKAELRKPLRQPEDGTTYVPIMLEIQPCSKDQHMKGERHWLPRGNFDVEDPKQYIITPFVGRNLRNLTRATAARKYPILIQGPTSAGKTSMIDYLAKRSGNKLVRINNHEHTDLQEYLGTYVSSSEGHLNFQEGVLVQALRQGHWVVLDELNLAPTDVLEALNRLLDDNRELLIPETQEIVRPHPNFMLFATQNPVGPYGGRKTLSRAFRNRFLELHFDDIPVEELNIILARRSNLPESWCGMIVEVYRRLSKLRQEQRLFESNSFATLRDLFRWAFREAESVEQLARNGYMLLAEKVRNSNERQNVKDIIEEVMSRKGVKIKMDESSLYTKEFCPEMELYGSMGGPGVIWTKAMRRIFVLVAYAIRSDEPVLLVGETGCGKTTVCQMLARALGKNLHVVNAHQNTETGDLIGAQRPMRNREIIDEQLLHDLQLVIHNIKGIEDGPTRSLAALLAEYDVLSEDQQKALPMEVRDRIRANRGKRKSLFEWHDGSIVQAMRLGEHYLLDEISLADDSVLERMNSVLDPQRSLLLAEKGTEDSLVVAQSGFQFLATMNPGGDFGKKELSPALRNRFTEIWVPPLLDTEDVLQITVGKIKTSAVPYAAAIVAFAKWFSAQYRSFKDSSISIRDILAWVDFINAQTMDLLASIFHGAAMVYIDTLGANPTALLAITGKAIEQERDRCFEKLSVLVGYDISLLDRQPFDVTIVNSRLQIGPFSISSGGAPASENSFNFDAPTTKINAMRVVRALQLTKPVLLEGNPGVGKTSIVMALAEATGSTLTRINLSEQTDLMDLFGSDVPVENAEAGHFAWKDAPFLTAMKRGNWVLLDEMNLASQSVLEGLNSCLDHRGEVYISELDQTFSRHPGFRLFAAQNPHGSSGRKGLPASFVNRFTVVYADILKEGDLILISSRMFPKLNHGLIAKLVSFVAKLETSVVQQHQFGTCGSPWEFNLRDIIRLFQLLTSPHGLLPGGNEQDFLTTLFMQRFRSVEDAQKVHTIFFELFQGLSRPRNYFTNLSSRTIQIGLGLLPRDALTQSAEAGRQIHIKNQLPLLESLMICVQQNWPVLLVGASGVGKTYMLESLASIAGSQLQTLSLSADIDATDLIGGYEQVDPATQAQSFLLRLDKYLRRCAASSFANNLCTDAAATINTLVDMIYTVSNITIAKVDFSLIHNALMELLRDAPIADLDVLLGECDEIRSRLQLVETAMFEWNDGMVIKALEEGRWLVLDNANLCSPSVLDRLNSLLEPNGSLIINEHCDKDGNAKVVKPHPNFRVFMTMDPQYGEVSRAMRNRAVELFVPPFEDIRTDSKECFLWDNLSLESSNFRFREIVDLDARIVRDASYEKIVEYSLESLSISKLKMLSSFTHQAYAGLLLMPNKSLPLSVGERLEAVPRLHDSWHVAPLAYYTWAGNQLNTPSDFSDGQPIHTLINPALVAYTEACVCPYNPYHLGRAYEFLLDLARMDEALKTTNNESHRFGDMTRLQRSLNSARLPNATKESTAWVAYFLINVKAIMITWIKTVHQDSQLDMTSMKVFTDIQIFWWNLFALVTSSHFEEAIFQVYLSLGKIMIAETQKHGCTSVQMIEDIAEQFISFSVTALPTTGLSMERIWPLFRPPTIATFDRMQELLQLEEMATTFDRLLWKVNVPITELISVRVSITNVLNLARTQYTSVNNLLKDVEEALATFSEVKDTTAAILPYFQPIFEGLCQYKDLTPARLLSYENELDDLTRFTTLLACRNAASASKGSANSPAQIFEALSNYAGFEGPAKQNIALEDNLGFMLLHKIAHTSSVPLRQLALLQSEVPILGRHLASETTALCDSQLNLLRMSLCSLVTWVLVAHEDLLETGWLDEIKQLLTQPVFPKELHSQSRIKFQFVSGLHRNHYFIQVAEKYLQPCLMLHSDKIDTSKEFCLSLAQTFIRFSVGCLLLYVPDRACDPALRSVVTRQLYDRRHRSLTKKLDALTRLEEFQTKVTTNLRTELVEQDLRALGPAPAASAIARPPASQLDGLQAEFANVLRIVATISREEALDQLLSSANSSLMDNVTQMIQRLTTGYQSYRDITMPAVGFLNCLRIGLLLAVRGFKEEDSTTKDISRVLGSTPFMKAQLCTWTSDSSRDSTEANLIWNGGPEVCMHTLRICAFRSRIEAPESWPRTTRLQLSASLELFYSRWKNDLHYEQKKMAAESSLYQYRGGQDKDEAAEEVEFHEMFPVFDEPSEPERHSDLPTTARRHTPQQLASTVTSLHMDIFASQSSPSEMLQKLMAKSVDLIAKLTGFQMPISIADSNQQLLPALFISLQEQCSRLLPSSMQIKNYNVYTDTNIHEAQRIVELIYETQQRFNPIRDIWPEHATLHNILNVCEELLAFEHAEPVMKFLTKAEKLYDYIAEWQSVTSKEHSANVVYNKLTDVLVSWRQLELSTWARLLDLEFEKCAENAKSWWFIAYENVIFIPLSMPLSSVEMTSHAINLISTLETFITTSTLGQYAMKLQMLASLLAHVKLITMDNPHIQPIWIALSNFVEHFARFNPMVTEQIITGRQALEKNVKEVILLASWKDRNINALKQGAKSSHRKLFKIVRKFRTLLAQPVNLVLRQDTPATETNASPSLSPAIVQPLSSVNAEVTELCQMNAQSWLHRPLRFRNVASTVSTMHAKTRLIPGHVDGHYFLDDLIANLGSSMEHLQKATPTTLTEENTSMIKHLTSRKRKLFADTLKEIRQMGMKSNITPAVLVGQSSLAQVLSRLPVMPPELLLGPGWVANSYLHRILDLMPIVRSAITEHSKDIGQAEITRSVGYLEKFLALTLRQRYSLIECMKQLQKLDCAIAQSENVWKPTGFQSVILTSSMEVYYDTLKVVTAWLPTMIRVGAQILDAQAQLGDLNFGNITSSLREWSEIFHSIHDEILAQPSMPQGLVNSDVMCSIKEKRQAIEDFKKKVGQWINETPQTKVVLDHILLWCDPGEVCIAVETNGYRAMETTEFDQRLYEVLDTVLGSIQDVEIAIQCLPTSSENKGWFVQEDKTHEQVLAAFHVRRVSRTVESLLTYLQHIAKSTEGDLKVASASVTMAIPIIKQYRSSFNEAIERYGALHSATCKTTYRLSKSFNMIVSQGFCKPAEKSTEKGGGHERLEAGTGLGDGDGADDISKDIANDEDLSELAQKSNDEKNEDGMEAEKDAVDIEDEFQGEAGDGMVDEEEETSAQEDDGSDREDDLGSGIEDGGQEGNSESKDTLDEGVGEVNELGPSTVDEKLWDQAGDETKKEKESGQSLGAAQNDEQVASKDGAENPTGRKEPEEEEDRHDATEEDQGDKSETPEGSEVATLEQIDPMDPHIKDSEGLDVPEELNLDGGKSPQADDDFDEEMTDDNGLLDDHGGDSPKDQMEEAAAAEYELEQEAKQDSETLASTMSDVPDQIQKKEEQLQMHQDNNGDVPGHLADATLEDEPGSGPIGDAADESTEVNATNADVQEMEIQPQEQSTSASSAQRKNGVESRVELSNREGHVQTSQGQQNGSDDTQERQAFRKLGDILEKWHRQQRKIRDSVSDHTDPKNDHVDIDMANQLFEHLPDEEAQTDTQALGPSTQDQARALDESMALQSTESDQHEHANGFLPDAEELPEPINNDIEIEEVDDPTPGKVADDQIHQARTRIGERTKREPSAPQQISQQDSDNKEALDEVEDHLSTIRIQPQEPVQSTADATNLWHEHESSTHTLALALTEHLRLILAPTLATRLRGDFRTGKRLNIKRIIPYIASGYKRDKIWMRRSIPSKRAFQVLLAIDDSKSMGENGSKELAFETLALIARSLSMLEVGEIGVVRFGEEVSVAHEFGAPFTSDAGAQVLGQFGFQQQRTNVRKLMEESMELLREARAKAAAGSSAGADLWQLQLIISDGICEDHEGIRRLLLQAQEERIMVVFVIVDAEARGRTSQSIVDLEKVEFVQMPAVEGHEGPAEMSLQRRKYLDSFPFGYYLIVKDVRELPSVLAAALRQWFAEVAER